MYGTILLGVDGSPHSERAVEETARLASATGDEVVVVHAQPFVLGGRAGLFTDEPYHEAEAMLDAAVKRLADSGVPATADLRRAMDRSVGQALLEAAEEYQAGLVVIGSRGHTALAGMLLGSVAHVMVHLSRSPVLVVRDREPDADRPREA
jgi:nucleotide-binding universal stress UspA family protein